MKTLAEVTEILDNAFNEEVIVQQRANGSVFGYVQIGDTITTDESAQITAGELVDAIKVFRSLSLELDYIKVNEIYLELSGTELEVSTNLYVHFRSK